MKSVDQQKVTIPLWSLIARKILTISIDKFYPTEMIDEKGELKKAVGEVKKGRGLILIFSHFSLRDAMEVSRCGIYKNKDLIKVNTVNPLAHYQYNWFLKIVGRLFYGNFKPIVNESTLKRKGFEHLSKGMGLNEFVTESGNILGRGGIVTLAINATRTEKLDLHDPHKPVGFLIAALKARGITNFGLMNVGFECLGAKSYKKKDVGGMNYGKKFIMRMGKYHTVDDLMKIKEIGGKASNVDLFLRKEMAKLVAKEYLMN